MPSDRLAVFCPRISLTARSRSSPWTGNGWWLTLRPELRFRCVHFSAAWELRLLSLMEKSTAPRLEFMPGTWITKNSSREALFTCRYMLGAHYSRLETDTPGKGMARWISQRWRLHL